MAEEHRCQTPEGHHLCVNNCGFLGSSTTMNLCSNCYGNLYLKQQQNSIKLTFKSISSPSIPPLLINPSVELEIPSRNNDLTPEKVNPPLQTTTEQQKRPNRCMVCRKRVGLTGFKCRCGNTFCGSHKYLELHGCSFDFKSIGCEEIVKANPLVIGVEEGSTLKSQKNKDS